MKKLSEDFFPLILGKKQRSNCYWISSDLRRMVPLTLQERKNLYDFRIQPEFSLQRLRQGANKQEERTGHWFLAISYKRIYAQVMVAAMCLT